MVTIYIFFGGGGGGGASTFPSNTLNLGCINTLEKSSILTNHSRQMQGNQEQTKTLTPSSPSSVLIDVWKKASQWRQRSFSAQSNLPPLLS